MAECNSCRSAIRGETGIHCEGVCKKVYHNTLKCSTIDNYTAGAMGKKDYARFVCDDCMQYVHNVDLVAREIQCDVNKIKQNLIEYKNEFEVSLKHNENEIKNLLEAIEKRYEERLKKIDIIQKSCNKNLEEMNKICSQANEVGNNNKEICNVIEEKNVKMCDEIKKILKETSVKQTKMSYAEKVKNTTVLPALNKQVPLIVKPKEKQGADITKQELNKKVDPINFKIINVENRRNGTVVIQSENDEEREKIKTAIQSEMSENYEIKVPNPMAFKVIITDITFKYSEEDIIVKLKNQNPILKDNEIKIIKTFEHKRNNRTIYNIKLSTDGETYNKLVGAQRVNLGWERCRVFDGTDVLQCFKCQGYNHLASECKNDETCFKCHGNHKAKDCKNEKIIKCINCMRVNKKLNMGLDENHVTNNRECPVYKNKLSMKKRKMGLPN